eukprot:TRINITY_DN25490_c0_g1_i1.p1 TRINITY_DN25490_c0_g1~~TRINITY_DN25490_c0_g1_i1.p1  ORF type:complete len:313 (+),score=80.28 TRINITY_DN25490_c0_g1_i1:98-1036(+)
MTELIRPSSLPGTDLEMVKARYAHPLRPFGLSRSTPTLSETYNLRQFSIDRGRIAGDRPATTATGNPRLERSKELLEIDLIGGNGAWRQRKAQVEFERRAAEEKERKRLEKLRDEERRKRKEMVEARRRQHMQEEERRRKEEAERQRRDSEEKERKRIQEEERRNEAKRLAEEEWRRRQPKMCKVCMGCTKCQTCRGTGSSYATFLVTKVDTTTPVNYGKIPQGCEDCGGYRHNILGALKLGNGACPNCNGAGSIVPKIDGSPLRAKRVGMLNLASGTGAQLGEVPLSPNGYSELASPKTPGLASPKSPMAA